MVRVAARALALARRRVAGHADRAVTRPAARAFPAAPSTAVIAARFAGAVRRAAHPELRGRRLRAQAAAAALVGATGSTVRLAAIRERVAVAALHPVAPPPRLLTLPGAHRGGRAECPVLAGREVPQRDARHRRERGDENLDGLRIPAAVAELAGEEDEEELGEAEVQHEAHQVGGDEHGVVGAQAPVLASAERPAPVPDKPVGDRQAEGHAGADPPRRPRRHGEQQPEGAFVDEGATRPDEAEFDELAGAGAAGRRACVGDVHGGLALGPPLRPGGRTSRIMNTKCVMVAKGDVAANRGTWSISWAGGASFARLRVLMASRA